MRSFSAYRFIIIPLLAASVARAQSWCEVNTAKPYSRNMPGITSVVLGSYQRVSAPIEHFPQNNYVQASDTVSVTPGQTYTIAITHTRDSVAFPRAGNNIRVWIDYDKDGSFEGEKDLVVTGDALVPGTSTFSFSVPRQLEPKVGTRMRITAKMSAQTGHSLPTPCDLPADGFGYHGEVEDYPVNILKLPEPVTETRSLESDLVRQFDRVSNLLVQMVERMPAEHFSFQPTSETRTFAAAVAHTIQAEVGVCSNLLKRRHELSGRNLQGMTDRNEAIAALRSVNAFCGEYTAALKPGDLTSRFHEAAATRDERPVNVRTPHASLLSSLIAHDNEMYGYLSVYLRLKGIVPPSSGG